MLPRADIGPTPITRVDPAGGVAVVADARQEAFQRSLSGSLGKSMQGQVLSRLTDGSFLVKVSGTSARMLLPEGAQVGHEVPLTLVSLSPRPTFQITSTHNGAVAYSEAAPHLPGARAEPLVYLDGGKAAAPSISADGAAAAAGAQAAPEEPVPVQRPLSHAAALLAKAPLTPSDRLPSIDPKSTPATLSDSARTIASVLAAAAPGTPSGISAAAPLVATPNTPPSELAGALKQSLTESGLFYESHVAEWSEGERPFDALAREPQMQPRGQAGAQSALPGVDAEMARFINLQLNTQDMQRVVWDGQPWPGQPMHWEVSKDAPERNGARKGDEHDAPWRSGLRLRLPLLGDIEVNVVLAAGQVHIQLDTGSSDTGSLLREHAGRLTEALDAAGLALSSLNIRAEAKA